MMEIGRLPNPRAAQALVDYLRGQGVSCRIQQAEHGVIVSVEREQDYSRAKAEFDHFISHPYDAKYLQASWEHGDMHAGLDYGAPALALFSRFLTGAGPVTLLVFALCILVYGAMQLGLGQQTYSLLSFFGAVSNGHAEVWRLFTPTLMHFSLMHISFNLLWWWYLGGKIETRLGTGPLLLLLLVAGTLPNLAQYLLTGPNFGGLSGVVYAVAGYTWVMGIKKPQAGIGLPPAYMGFMLLWMLLGFFDVLGMSMANGAHLAGLVIGLGQGWLDSRKP
ncbi:rhomboid family intramembrane serine protease GlpG [Shewanella sedimentimangrovi]|uniref:Rhomboid family intramembrane serine protease GlpG n=1 Tax=Shewanella sedimentimangrovi TaxID=2814293 RepID=A0ABX7R527_9GAMM|nr:rhomboid family intramembrane serine protease GlpG [Shewanella sedimentimangrovi]QSX38952.1 rhomboid family intramembrane serine protease GlpG [Shewanella sedimentimangrovi]